MVGGEEWFGGRVEQEQTVESDGDRYVVGNGAVEITGSWAEEDVNHSD